ncbi:MAG: WecB/TagA/CpsF family glycosyltransferase, partial [Candidatus Subteraquimicrobiales bacterium]|nr:WecB/TagA/CpsF family glycosyltransferase [Candidatus Subteraquimicrobiales bacterium]
IIHSTLSIPDGIGLKFAFKYLYGLPLEIIKGRELFLDIIKIADERHLRVYLFGGEHGEQIKTKEILEKSYKNVIFKTHHEFPQYDKNCQPTSVIHRKLHKRIVGSIKMFEPDLIFVAMNTPKQEKWIFRNFFRLKATGAMAVGGTFNYIVGSMKLPPKWMEKLGLEWVYRLIQEPQRLRRILNAFPIFPWKVFMWKLFK